ncbi:MAG TPA: phosphoribosylformylglycinamidine synthase subunit PurL [Actinomycetota bacterium]|nr:phosphoribosylformylglycinamidine synthase subunit PurL [Actinomycetota bacterium]
MSAAPVPEPLHRQLGLRDDELDLIRESIERGPNATELAMYAVMWSEHCSYKSSKVHLRTLPTEGDAIIVGPGQDAGAVDLGDGVAAVFKMESHSHPSAIEPYQGAATGVGGIVRDIVSMGARPVALLDPLMFGPLDQERNRWLLEGVVAGIGGYGNCIGVPTVGGEVRFADPHSANPTVNVLCVGFAPADRLITATTHRPGAGSLMVLYGATTGRDGIGGVSVLASASLDEGGGGSRPSVQIGDPFAEKLLIEASLELVGAGLLEGLQDLGGAGLTCAVSESAARAGLGAVVELDEVPLREPEMEAFEILTSESQERMLAIVSPANLERVRAVCAKWGLGIAVVATLEPGGELDVRKAGATVARVPALSLTEKAPEYQRAMRPVASDQDDPTFVTFDGDLGDALVSLLAAPNVASKRWVFEQYDRMVQGQTVAGPGSDAAVVRVPGTMKGVALSVDGNGRYGSLDPYLGGAHAVAEAARNVAVSGATPLAITNCLNFGNPERPEVMWQFAEAVRGMGDACLALGTPVTGGNVSFYNEAEGSSIWPTPVVGVLGTLADHRLRLPSGFPGPGLAVYLLGESFAELGGSEFAETLLGTVSGTPPALDLQVERRLQDLLQEAAAGDLLASAHDCSDGGIAVCLAECAILGGHGFAVTLAGDMPAHVLLFGESASRVVVAVSPEREGSLRGLAATRGVPFARLGETGGPRAVIDGMIDAPVAELTDVWEQAIPRLLGEA